MDEHLAQLARPLQYHSPLSPAPRALVISMLVPLAGLMGASGIILAAGGAPAAPGAGLDNAGYMLLFHAVAVLSGAALLQQRVLLWPLAFAALVAWVLGAALFSGDKIGRASCRERV